MGRARRSAVLILAALCGLVSGVLVLLNRGDGVVWVGQGDFALPDELLISSSCITQRWPGGCSLSVNGGRLHITNITFPHGLGKSGTAYATGVVNGEVVEGTIAIQGDPDEESQGEEEKDVKKEREFGALDKDTQGYNRTKSGFKVLDPIDAQYQSAMQQLEGNMESRKTTIAKNAKRIAKAVTKVLTSDAVSSTIADMAWNLAEKKYHEAGSLLDASEIEQAATAGINAATGRGPVPDGGLEMHQQWDATLVPPHLSDASASASTPGGVSALESETIADNPAAGVAGPPAGSFSGLTCTACLACPGCCQNGWVPGCLAFNKSSGGAGQGAPDPGPGDADGWGGETVGQEIGKTLLFDPKEVVPEFNRIDAQWKASLAAIQRNVAGQKRQQQLYREMQREKEKQQLIAQRKARAKQRKLQQAEYVPLENILIPAEKDLPDPFKSLRDYEKNHNGYMMDASARYTNTEFPGVQEDFEPE